MRNRITENYFALIDSDPLNICLNALPESLQTELRNPDSLDFSQEQRQTYQVIRQHIYSKNIALIHEENLLYNLVQECINGNCTPNNMADILLFYTFIKCGLNDYEISKDQISFENGSLVFKSLYKKIKTMLSYNGPIKLDKKK